MNWKLIFQLSLFGLAMGIATVFYIPSNMELFYWLGIFVYCAYVIGRKAEQKYFLHGFMVSMVNSVWITSSHIILFDNYISNHQEEAAMMSGMTMIAPQVMMAITGPIVGAVSGCVLGLFSFFAARVLKRRASKSF